MTDEYIIADAQGGTIGKPGNMATRTKYNVYLMYRELGYHAQAAAIMARLDCIIASLDD